MAPVGILTIAAATLECTCRGGAACQPAMALETVPAHEILRAAAACGSFEPERGILWPEGGLYPAYHISSWLSPQRTCGSACHMEGWGPALE